MNRNNYLVIALVIIPLAVVAGVVRYQRGEQQVKQQSDLQQLRESERALKMKADPLPYVQVGMAVKEVEKVLGTGEPAADNGEDLLLWYGAGNGGLWTLVATVENDRVYRPTVMRGDGDRQFRREAAISLHRQRGAPKGEIK